MHRLFVGGLGDELSLLDSAPLLELRLHAKLYPVQLVSSFCTPHFAHARGPSDLQVDERATVVSLGLCRGTVSISVPVGRLGDLPQQLHHVGVYEPLGEPAAVPLM
jgi:hypothetical protein